MEYIIPLHLFNGNANSPKIVFSYIDKLAEIVFDISLIPIQNILSSLRRIFLPLAVSLSA